MRLNQGLNLRFHVHQKFLPVQFNRSQYKMAPNAIYSKNRKKRIKI